MPLESKFLELLRQLSWKDLINVNINYDKIFGTGLYNYETGEIEDYEDWRKRELSALLP